jgi:hypothetical protein
MIYTHCHKYDTSCRFLSNEFLLVPYNQLITNPKTNRLEPSLQTMLRKEPIGEYCNNVSDWVENVNQCPARLALVRWTGIKVDGAGIYHKLTSTNEMREIMRES